MSKKVKKTTIFEHKGRVGIQAGDKLLNNPDSPGQLGCLVDLSDVIISEAASLSSSRRFPKATMTSVI